MRHVKHDEEIPNTNITDEFASGDEVSQAGDGIVYSRTGDGTYYSRWATGDGQISRAEYSRTGDVQSSVIR